jgi:hypothetical protein
MYPYAVLVLPPPTERWLHPTSTWCMRHILLLPHSWRLHTPPGGHLCPLDFIFGHYPVMVPSSPCGRILSVFLPAMRWEHPLYRYSPANDVHIYQWHIHGSHFEPILVPIATATGLSGHLAYFCWFCDFRHFWPYNFTVIRAVAFPSIKKLRYICDLNACKVSWPLDHYFVCTTSRCLDFDVSIYQYILLVSLLSKAPPQGRPPPMVYLILNTICHVSSIILRVEWRLPGLLLDQNVFQRQCTPLYYLPLNDRFAPYSAPVSIEPHSGIDNRFI